MMINSRARTLTLAIVVASMASSCARFHKWSDAGQEWIGAWTAPPQLTEPGNMPPTPGLSGMTLRQVIHPSLGGEQGRFRFSNEFGDGPVGVGATRGARAETRRAPGP